MFFFRFFLATLLLTMGWSTTSLALASSEADAGVPRLAVEPSDVASTQVVEKPEPIQHLENQGLDVVRSFPVGQSLMGWVVSFEGKDMIVYTTLDGDYLINGILLDAQGVDKTERHQKTFLPRPAWTDLSDAYYLTEPSQAVGEEGQLETSTQIYVFFDPNCPFSQLAWLALQPYREAGAEVRWVPVAYLKPDSRHRAAALLDADQPEQLLARNMTMFGQPDAELDVAIEAHHRKQLQANMSLMQALGINGTPGWVWLDQDEELHTLSGMPRLPRLADMTGLPEQRHSETELMRFR